MVSQGYQSIEEGTASGQQATPTTTRPGYAPQRPWRQLVDRSAFGKPESFADARYRLKRNLRYFRLNYVIFMLVVICLSLLWHPIALLVLAVLVAAWMYLYFCRAEPLKILGKTLGDPLVLSCLGIVTIVALFLAGGGTALIIGLVVGALVVAFHGSFRRTDDLFSDEEEIAAP